MSRFQYLLLFISLLTSFSASAQQGQELDTLRHFDFLKKYPETGDYIIDRTKDPFGDSILRIHFLSEFYFSNAQFDYRADFSNAQFDSEAKFSGVHFDSLANFYGAQFDSLAKFSTVHFDSEADFTLAQFDSEADFSDAQFYSLADFSAAQFDSLSYFSATHFESEAIFFLTQFGYHTDFRDAHFNSGADFSYVHFNSGVDFKDAQFDSLADFYDAQFDSLADFQDAQFDSLADFSNSQFDYRADFSGAQFKGEVDFWYTDLPDTLIFKNVKTSHIIDLTTTLPFLTKKEENGFCMIDLRGAPIDKFKFYYGYFRIYWPPEINYAEEAQITNVYEQLTNVYQALLKNFKDRGYLSSYATLDKEYQAFKDLQNPDAGVFKKFFNKVNYLWNNYGYNKERIWLWTVIFLTISTLINWLAFPYLVKDVYPVPMIDQALFKGNPVERFEFKSFRLRDINLQTHSRYLVLAFFYTCLIFFGLKLSTERINFDKYRGVALIFTEYLIGLICLGYLANFIISSGLIGK